MKDTFGITVSDRTKRLLAEGYGIDCRESSFMMYSYSQDEKPDYWVKMKNSGLTAICTDPCYVDCGFRAAAIDFAHWYQRLRKNDAILVESTEDIVRAKKEGKLAYIFAMQSPEPIEDQICLLEVMHRMGLRMTGLSYQRRNYLADGGYEPSATGLSRLGFEALQEMNRLGLLVDLAHTTDQVMWDVLNNSKQPVINSHSCVRSLHNHKRNVGDDVMKALAEKGGVMCIATHSSFLKKGGTKTGTTIDDMLEHIDYALNIMGEDGVGIGFDVGECRNDMERLLLAQKTDETRSLEENIYRREHPETIKKDPPENRYVRELSTRENYPLLIEKMVQHGYSDELIMKIMGGNVMRVFKEVWGK